LRAPLQPREETSAGESRRGRSERPTLSTSGMTRFRPSLWPLGHRLSSHAEALVALGVPSCSWGILRSPRSRRWPYPRVRVIPALAGPYFDFVYRPPLGQQVGELLRPGRQLGTVRPVRNVRPQQAHGLQPGQRLTVQPGLCAQFLSRQVGPHVSNCLSLPRPISARMSLIPPMLAHASGSPAAPKTPQ
jgi:hypothetical protein